MKLLKKQLFLLVILTLFITSINSVALAQTEHNNVTIYFFWGDGCPHCATEKPFLEKMQQKYPDIEIKMFETWTNPENAKLFNDVAKAYGTTAQGVPTTFIGDRYWVGYADYMSKEMESKINYCLENKCINPKDALEKGSVLSAQKNILENDSGIGEKKEEPNNLINQSIETICIHAFITENCVQCDLIVPFLESSAKNQTIKLKIHNVSVEDEKELYKHFKEVYSISNGGFPVVFMGDRYLLGETAILNNFNSEIDSCKKKGCVCPLTKIIGLTSYPPQPKDITPEKNSVVNLPILGEIDTANMSMPLFTIILAGLDSFNPCAFFVLFFLLSMLIYAKNRKRMLLIGFTFVFFSALIYFLFMAAWLNLFLLIGQLMIITSIAGIVALIVAAINIKDFFFFNKGGVSLSISDKAKPKLFQRMRNLLKANSIWSMMVGTVILAIAANSYELLCTAGFPMVFTRILTLHGTSTGQYYFYLAMYNLIYIVPLLIIVLMFVITLGAKKLTEWQGQVLKLISGMMMLCLGSILLIKPALLNNIFVSMGLMVAALSTAGIIIFFTKKIKKNKKEGEDNELSK